ncbi:hypothetical protein LuPra_06298 [Luteitalea pratensis]|uniref:DUF3014 domain-containing protein n=1 Tax=Luteitalea pratensis TaxID=1855912 RepID=A0A143PWR1_LUTPR|nr:hypothetical protein LuPra_06298 [Luteitalea pratensis]
MPRRDHTANNRLAWIGLFVLVAVVVGALWWWAPRTSKSPAEAIGRVPTEEVVERPVPQVQGLGVGEPDPNLPPLGNLDGYVRPLLAVLSSRPELAALLASDGLVRRFAVSVDAIARGDSPAGQVRAVAPRAPFKVQQRGDELTIDPASYARYDGLVILVEDMPTPQLARLYGRLKPRLEEAYAELGAGGTFDDAMTRAIRHLLATPLPPPNAQMQQARGINYAYNDERYEGLSAAQRQLLRLGPDRARRVQERLRAFGIALGIPADQLRSRS